MGDDTKKSALEPIAKVLGVPVETVKTKAFQTALAVRPYQDFSGGKVPEIKEPHEYEKLKNSPIISEKVTVEASKNDPKDDFTIWRSKDIDPTKKTLVFFPGNGGHLGRAPASAGEGKSLGTEDAYMDVIKAAMDKGYNVVAVNYVGFKGSNVTAQPTEERVHAGVKQVNDYLEKHGIAPKDRHYNGVSLGTTMASLAAADASQRESFKQLPAKDQVINLQIVNSNLDSAHAMVPLLGLTVEQSDAVRKSGEWTVNNDTGAQLKILNSMGKKANVTVVRGAEDPATLPNQDAAHRNAAPDTNFHMIVEPKVHHYLSGERTMEIFKAMEQGTLMDKLGKAPAPAQALGAQEVAAGAFEYDTKLPLPAKPVASRNGQASRSLVT